MPKVLIVTNDFPPRSGGIQSFVHALATRLPAGTVTVYAPAWEGAAGFDARQPFPVIRHPTSLMLPVPSVSRRAVRILADHGCDTVLFGAAAPLGLLAPALRRAGARRIVALTHGHEAGWAALPGARTLLRRIGDQVDVVTYLGEYFRVRLARALSPQAAGRMVRLAPGVDPAAFRPGVGGAAVRRQLGLEGRPIVLCVSRMVPRKGQDTLLQAWPQVLAAAGNGLSGRTGNGPGGAAGDAAGRIGVGGPGGGAGDAAGRIGVGGPGGGAGDAAGRAGGPGPGGAAGRAGVGGAGDAAGRIGVGGPGGGTGDPAGRAGGPGPGGAAGRAAVGGAGAASGGAGSSSGEPVLLLVGNGPYRAELGRLASRLGVTGSVMFTGPVSWQDLPAYYDAADVFAMPCRTRRHGLDVEGLGIVYLEASAAGLPVIGGDSGGAPDAILPGESGYVVPGGDVAAVAGRLTQLLGDPAAAAAMGEKGMAWVEREWRWELVARRLQRILTG